MSSTALLPSVVRGERPASHEPRQLARDLPSLTALTAAATLAPGLVVSLFPQTWHICWSGAGIPTATFLAVFIGAPLLRALHQAHGEFPSWTRVLHAQLSATSRAALFGLLALPVLVAAALLGASESTAHLLISLPLALAAVMGLQSLWRTLPMPVEATLPVRAAVGAVVGIAATAAVYAVGTCGDPLGSWLPDALPPAVSLGALWLGGGTLVGALLHRRGLGSVAGALVAWPWLLPLLAEAPVLPSAGGPDESRGPLGLRIARAFDRLEHTLAQADPTGLPGLVEARALRRELEAADARLVLADRLLAEEELAEAAAHDLGELRQSVARLAARRARAAAEIEQVLASMHQLRVEVGILALAGESAPVQQRLEGLRLRIRALQEVEGG